MGTGSHRPQWEAAKGRPDVTGGIAHSRALKSHSQLKFRAQRHREIAPEAAQPREILAAPTASASTASRPSPKLTAPFPPAAPAARSARPRAPKGSTSGDSAPPPNDSDADLPSGPGSESEDDDTEELAKELARLKQRGELRAQLRAQKTARPASSWRADAAFKRSTPRVSKSKPNTKSASKSQADSANKRFLDRYVK